MNQLSEGQTLEISKLVTNEYVLQTAEWSGDRNPVHLSDDFAAGTRFKKRIAHGLVCLGMVSNVLGNSLQGAILVGQTVQYNAPVYIGDTITCKVTVEKLSSAKHLAELQYTCINQDNINVTSGTIRIKYPH
ncbi:MaoC family dehydratase [Subdoligranulum variabile]|uniref:MaoC family dehydratase n=1 Tax=Subdoligranulum variabile TaxID=214851 RepID=UPI0026F294B9|nr:MaoC family dehydratase [Subdoligranulum variabile]